MSSKSFPLNWTELDVLLAVLLCLDIYSVGLLPRELASLGNHIIYEYDYGVIYTDDDWLFFYIAEQEKSYLCQFWFKFGLWTLMGNRERICHVSYEHIYDKELFNILYFTEESTSV